MSDAAPARRAPGRPAIARTTPLTLDGVIEAAHRIVSEQGLQALSMRVLARDLGVTAMSIYRYVPNKPTLVQALIDDIWRQVAAELPTDASDLVEFIVQVSLATRRVWLENLELANLAMAVAPAGDNLIETVIMTNSIVAGAGFTDVPLAYGATQTYTMGSIAITANRRVSSAYFGRDPDAVLAEAQRLLDMAGAPHTVREVLEARFDERDDLNFEPGLRALVHGLLHPQAQDGKR